MIKAIANSDGTVSLIGKQGTSWFMVINVFSDPEGVIPLNLNGYSARGEYKIDYKPTSKALITFICTVLPFDAVTNPNQNKVSIEALPEQSSAVSVKKGVYDIEVFKGDSIVERILEGTLELSLEVTRS